MTTEIAVRNQASGELSIEQLGSNMEKLREVMRSVMVKDTDYGTVPGTKSKPTLLKPGGEKLAMMFRFAPEYHEEVAQLPNGHREYQVKCRLIHVPSQAFVGEASAVCSTLESKYRYRGGARKCPQCGKEAIKKSKFPPRDQPQKQPGFYCYNKIGGCGANFDADDPDIIGQSEARTENPDIADSYNTVKQIAQKRAFISAIKTATASSELFTQDVEDGVVPGVEVQHHEEPPDEERHETPPRRRQSARAPVQETHEWELLKAELLKLGCQAGHADQAEAVIKHFGPACSLVECRKRPEMARDVLDKIDLALKQGDTAEEILKAAGVLLTA